MRVLPALSLAIAATLALGGCNKDKGSSQGTAAGGELLPRSVSDDMLPYDTATSQPSLSNPDAGLGVSSGGGPKAAATAGADDNDDVVTGDPAVDSEAQAQAPAATQDGE